MTLLERALEAMKKLLEKEGFPLETKATARALGIKEALGDPAPYRDFALQRGVEKLMDMEILGFHGQSFTSRPCNWVGKAGEALSLDLTGDKERSLAAGALNALTRAFSMAKGTVHCKDCGMDLCGKDMALEMKKLLKDSGTLAILGYQPAILSHITEVLGKHRIMVSDLNPDNIGQVRFGVKIQDGDKDMESMAKEASLCLATGSSIVNGTADHILDTFKSQGKDVIFFGTSIAGVSALLGLKRLCPRSL